MLVTALRDVDGIFKVFQNPYGLPVDLRNGIPDRSSNHKIFPTLERVQLAYPGSQVQIIDVGKPETTKTTAESFRFLPTQQEIMEKMQAANIQGGMQMNPEISTPLPSQITFPTIQYPQIEKELFKMAKHYVKMTKKSQKLFKEYLQGYSDAVKLFLPAAESEIQQSIQELFE